MGYRSQVRIVSTKSGFEKLKAITVCPECTVSLLEELDKYHESDGLVYFGWDYIKWYEDYSDVRLVLTGIEDLYEQGEVFKLARLGEDFGDFYTEQWDDEDVLPDIYPYQGIDDNYTEEEM